MITENNATRHQFSPIKDLISRTKEEEIIWIQLSGLRDYLANDDISLLDIHRFQNFFRSARSLNFFPVIEHSYISVFERKSVVYILSQDARTKAMFLSYMHTDSRSTTWRTLLSDQVSLNRLFNIIRLIAPHDSVQEYDELLYSINDVRV